jgi:hypothetical protein
MAYEKKTPLTEKQRADLNALAQKVENAYGDFGQAIDTIGPDEEWDGSCLACPKTPGGAVCSSFLGNSNSSRAMPANLLRALVPQSRRWCRVSVNSERVRTSTVGPS